MSKQNQSRRGFLKTTAAASAVAAATPYIFTGEKAIADDSKSANDRPLLGCIGTGSRWNAVGPNAMAFADCVAVCDVDGNHRDRAHAKVTGIQKKAGRDRTVEKFKDYRKVLDNPDIDVVTIVTPDHWHSKIAIEAMQAGKDVYCEKPLTLTIDEGKLIRQTVEKTGRVFQVGTQQRSEMNLRFLNAVAVVRDGRIGELKKVTCTIGGAPTSGEIPVVDPPANLDWNMWLGQAPLVAYRTNGKNTRCHYEFRWWYEYSGGKMTDWGAHHVDIAHWAMAMDDDGPTSIKGTAKHPVPFKNGFPEDDSRYNASNEFQVVCQFPGDIELTIRSHGENGIKFEGTKGEIFVSRGALRGEAIDDLKKNPLSDELLKKLYKGKTPGGGNAHMRNLFDCIKDREQPISDVASHHRAMTTCHLANIAIRLDRELKWDAKTENIVGDDEAKGFQTRKQRKGFEVKV